MRAGLPPMCGRVPPYGCLIQEAQPGLGLRFPLQAQRNFEDLVSLHAGYLSCKRKHLSG